MYMSILMEIYISIQHRHFLIHFIRYNGAYLGIDVVEFENIVDIGPFFDTFLVNIGWFLANN